MRFRHRALAALTALILTGGAVPAPLFAVPAIAEEAAAPKLEITVTASQDPLAAPDEIALTFLLTNQTDSLLEGVCLSSPDGLLVEPIGDIAPGETHSYIHTTAVTEEELDAGAISYIITCVAGSEHFSYPVEAAIQRSTAEPQVEFLRQVSNQYVTDAGSATIVYEVRNTGSVDIRALEITDPLGSFTGRLDDLDAGERRRFVQYVSISQDSVSSPTLTYTTAGGSQSYSQKLDDLTICAAHGDLDASITAGRSMFSSDSAEVILTLTNNGNVDYQNVTIYDDIYGGIIADSIFIPAGGEPVEVAHSYPLREDSSYRWRVTGTTSAGDRIDFISNTAAVYLGNEGSNPLLTLRASTSMTKINRSGYVPVRLEINNIGSAMASNILIREENLGDVCELAVVPTGDPTIYELRYEVRQNTTLTFTATYADSYGQERVATSDPIEIAIGPGGQTPETGSRPNSLIGGLSTQISNSPLFMGLLIGSCVVLVVLIVVLAITSRRARARRKERAAARKQRLKEDMAKTARFKPVRSKINGKSGKK